MTGKRTIFEGPFGESFPNVDFLFSTLNFDFASFRRDVKSLGHIKNPLFQGNIVYIVFDEPVTISMIKLWNYSKTPARGVRQFGVSAILFRGVFRIKNLRWTL